ncbi:MAG: molybdenum cofactor guanylyltransferase [Bacteroidetes bacterium]|nr:molybdenum cofactor guanylyltransferase [Bacteroidota bacterium]
MGKIKKNINGYILAGGKSSRMGTDKGLMLYKGKEIIKYSMEQLQPIVDKVVIVSNNMEYEKLGVEVIPDLIKDIGPAGGIYSALDHSDVNLNFIVSCDMPFITKEAINFIIENTSSSQITLPCHHGQLEPLFGVYTKTCLVQWLTLINQGCIKIKDLASNFDLRTINIDDNELFHPTFFTNINTKEDFLKAFHAE